VLYWLKVTISSGVAAIVLQLPEGGEFEAQMKNRIPMFKFSTNAPILANPC